MNTDISHCETPNRNCGLKIKFVQRTLGSWEGLIFRGSYYYIIFYWRGLCLKGFIFWKFTILYYVAAQLYSIHLEAWWLKQMVESFVVCCILTVNFIVILFYYRSILHSQLKNCITSSVEMIRWVAFHRTTLHALTILSITATKFHYW